MRLLIMGAPGAGKGTQAVSLAQHYQIPAISTGGIFRHHIKNQTPIGVKVKQIIDAGDYVPDELTQQIVAERLAEDDAKDGFLLDGFPRTMSQVHFLAETLGAKGQSIDAVVSLVVDPEELIKRLLKRAEIEGRADDNETTIRRRMEVYQTETAPLLAHYADAGLVVEVEGSGTPDEVGEKVRTALQDHTGSKC